MNSSNTKNNIVIDGDKTRRKRLKVVSACGECRRKKTKCNGERPCAGCLKAHVECKYVFTQKSNITDATAATSNNNSMPPTHTITTTIQPTPAQQQVTATTATTAAASTTTAAMKTKIISLNNNISMMEERTKPISSASIPIPASSSASTVSSIESIEERLGAIENILRTLLGSGKNKHLLQGLEQQQRPPESMILLSHHLHHHQQRYNNNNNIPPPPPPPHHHQQQHNNNHGIHHTGQQQHSDKILCGDMYSSTTPHSVHASPTQNRRIPRAAEKRKRRHDEQQQDEQEEEGGTGLIRDDFGHGYNPPHHKLQLAPIKTINHHHSPATPAIRNLLNEDSSAADSQQDSRNNGSRWYPSSNGNRFTAKPHTPPSTAKNSAFFRMSSSPRLNNDIIHNTSNSAPAAAGTSS
jgi:hypothetical protein